MSRLRIITLFVALVALVTAVASCGGGGGSDDPQAVVDEATLKGIDSGNVDLALGIDVKGENGGHVDVSLTGPFQSEGEGQTSELEMSLKADGSLGGKKVDFEGGLTLLGSKAYVGFDGTEYEVDPTTFSFVKSILESQAGGKGQSGEATDCQEALSELEPAEFMDNLSDDGSVEVGGTSTTKVSGDLDAPGAVEALVEVSEEPACRELGAASGQLPSTEELDDAQDQVKDSVQSAHVDLYVGDDDIVRRVSAQATIEPPEGSAKGGAESVDLDLDLTLTGVNEEQQISAPEKTRPLSELFLKLGINPIELLGLLQGGEGLSESGGLNDLLEGLGSAGSAQ